MSARVVHSARLLSFPPSATLTRPLRGGDLRSERLLISQALGQTRQGGCGYGGGSAVGSAGERDALTDGTLWRCGEN